MSEETRPQPDWKQRNFHQVMVLICDTFNMTHPQMVSLRQRIEKVYGSQKQGKAHVSVQALAILAYQRLDAGETLDEVLDIKSGKLLKLGRKIDEVQLR